ncbi:DUF6537 domain-containing protein, partial [Leisingera sp. F5]|uniref:DUF6537 domain-containing protein n=1 Tax=Leisingera sp. F5 TaxID=1813816 RepID=UPI000B10578B
LKVPFDLLVTGVGGTGVVTVGALITMAAHLEGKGSSVLDFTGFAQKFGTVLSYIRLSKEPGTLNQVRIEQGGADAVIGCDVVVSSAPKASAHYRAGTKVVLNRAEMPTGDLVLRRDADLLAGLRERTIAEAVGEQNLSGFNANEAAETMLGDAVLANVMMLGFAWQQGLVPVSAGALDQAIELNGVAIERNRLAFAIGRAMAEDPKLVASHFEETPAKTETLDALIERRATFLTGYQNMAYAGRYTAALNLFRDALPAEAQEELTAAAARALFKLMAYKDEYEVARLLTSDAFQHQLEDEFEGDFSVKYHLAPPLLSWKKDARGRPAKRAFGPWLRPAMHLLAKAKTLRGSAFNIFGYHEEAR